MSRSRRIEPDQRRNDSAPFDLRVGSSRIHIECIRANIRAMAGYVPGEQLNDPDIIKLNTNENPYPPSPRVFEAIRAALTGDQLRKYPEPLGDAFRQAAGRVLGVDPDGILIGNGSDDILTILTRAFVPEGGLIVSPTPSYLLYQLARRDSGGALRDRAVHRRLAAARPVAAPQART